MDKKKKNCKCTKRRNNDRRPPVLIPCTDVSDIAEALACASDGESSEPSFIGEVGSMRSSKRRVTTKRKPKKPRPVPMTPAMDSRLQYIGHCPREQKLKTIDAKTRKKFYGDLELSSSDEGVCNLSTCPVRKRAKKKVHYYNNEIIMPMPQNVALHETDEIVLSLVSPKTSGEVIRAQKTAVKPFEQRPPIPAQSGHALFKPHSGIVVNRQADFVPDAVHLPPPPYDYDSESTKHQCTNRTCKKKKCIRFRRGHKHSSRYKSYRGYHRQRKRSIGTSRYRADDDACGPDDIPRPEQVRIPCNLRRGTIQTHSLTIMPCTKDRRPDIHYGILTGSFNMYDAKFGARSRGRQALPMSVMAYCLAFHYHPKQWTMKLLDNLLDAGDKWYLQCADKVHDHSAVQGICEVLPFGKKQTMVLNRKRMQVLLGEPEIVGYTMSVDPTVYNLCRGLKAFFKENRAGILLTRVLKLVIWKDRVCFYIFDPAGRDTRGYSNFTTGAAALVNVKDVESVSEVLLARSIIEDQKYVLAPVKCLKMIDEKEDDDLESDKELTQAEKAMMGYRILNETCAIVNANMHLGDRCFEEAKFRQALPIAVMAMTYAKISPPNTWHTKTLDKILRLGNKLYVDCSNPKVLIDITIDNIPNEIIIGPYANEIIIYRERTKGQMFTTKECLHNIRTGLKDFFSKEYNSGILQFNNFSLGIWRQKDMYYLFDPYPRTSDGLTSVQGGKACVHMLLNPDAMATALEKNWDYLPVTTQFYIHAFKVLKLKKKDDKSRIQCSLSDDEMTRKKVRRTILPEGKAHGDYDGVTEIMSVRTAGVSEKTGASGQPDEEHMGDIISLVDSIQEDYLPPIPLRYKKPVDETFEEKIVNLDSPTVSVTQIVPPWPKPRDKSNEQPDLDPEPEPEPEPEPPPPPKPEGYEEEELGEEEQLARQRREEERKRLEEEEKYKAVDLPPPISPPPPTPQDDEPQLASPPARAATEPQPDTAVDAEEEIPAMEFARVDRRILLTEDARVRHKLRQQRRKISQPLVETDAMISTEYELQKPSNFKPVLDGTQIIRGNGPIAEYEASDILPFTAIMAIITSYKYSINTWTPGIVTFVQDAARKLHDNKQQKFQLAPIHIIPYIALGTQAYQANIDVIGEGPTWRLEDILERKFFPTYDRGMITTSNYSCAIFVKNGLYYLYDGTHCNGLGLRHCTCARCNKGKPAFMRFTKLHDLANRILNNKDGPVADQQFILSRVVVRKLCKEARMKLPEDYDYETGTTKAKKSSMSMVDDKVESVDDTKTDEQGQPLSKYQLIDGAYRIEGTTGLRSMGCGSSDVKACHFICLIAMLMATMHPIRTWNHLMVDVAVEKGIEIYNKAKNTNVCEKRVIKNIILDGKFIDVNIKKLMVVNENRVKTLEQYVNAVVMRLRYVIIRFPQASFVICQADGYYHLFDAYPAVKFKGESDELVAAPEEAEQRKSDDKASWTLYRCLETLVARIKYTIFRDVNSPEFYTFELTSVKNAPRNFAITYRLSPLFKSEKNPNVPYLKRRRIYPTVDEKIYWLNIDELPWSRMMTVNDVGIERRVPQSMWRDWDIEFPGDLFSLWGTIHPKDSRFASENRGKQYLHVYAIALATSIICDLGAWTSNLLDGIVATGDKFYEANYAKIKGKANVELTPSELDGKFDEYPFSYNFKFDKVIFGFVYNIYPDRFNLSKSLAYFFEKHDLGILVSAQKNLAFGRINSANPSYFMIDCQSYGTPTFVPGQGAAYILKCESLNRLIYCMTITMNLKQHGQLFHLYTAKITMNEK